MRFERSGSSWAFVLIAFFSNILPQTCMASPNPDSTLEKRAAPPPIPATPFYIFPNGGQAENIKPRLSGQLLVTINSAAELYQINPLVNQSGGLVHRFDGYTSLFGIVELQPDIFYVTAGNYTGAPDYYGFKGTFSVFKVDLRKIPDPAANQKSVKVSNVVDIPQAQLLDGFAVFNAQNGLLVTGDTQTGTLYLIDVRRGTATAVLQDDLLAGTSSERSAGLAHLGINGLKVYSGDVYFTNTAKGTYGKINGNCIGNSPCNPTIIANYNTYTDDLSFSAVGDQFISVPLQGILLRPAENPSSDTRLFATLPGANSNAFGRTSVDRCILYSTFVGPSSGIAMVDTTTAQGYCCGYWCDGGD